MSDQLWVKFWVKFQEVPGWVLSDNPGNIFKLDDAPNVPHLREAFRVTISGRPAMNPEGLDKCLAAVYVKHNHQTIKLVYVRLLERFELRLIKADGEVETYRWYDKFGVAMEAFIESLPVKNVGNPMNHIIEPPEPKPKYEGREGFGRWA